MSKYEKCTHCGVDCAYHDAHVKPCHGKVEIIYVGDCGSGELGELDYIHACVGHTNTFDTGEYNEEVKDVDPEARN